MATGPDVGTIAEGTLLERCEVDDSVVGLRSTIRAGAQIRQSVLLAADYFEDEGSSGTCRPASAAMRYSSG